MINAWLKIQFAIQLHLVDYPPQGTTSPLTTTAGGATKITFSWTTGTNNIYDYGLYVETITDNYLKQVTLVDVINQADNIAKASGASGKVNLTVPELLSLSLQTQS